MINWEPYLKHPVIIILLAGAVSVSGTFAVLNYHHSEKIELAREKSAYEVQKINDRHATELHSFNARLKGIERRLGGNQHLDITTLFKNRNIEKESASLNLKYYEPGNFYATSDDKKWHVKKIFEPELHQEIVGVKMEDLFSPAVLTTMKQFQTWLWRGKLEHKVSGSDVIKKIFPYLMVQSIPNETLGNFHVQGSVGSGTPFEIGDDLFDPKDLQAFQMKVSSDAAAVYLTRKLHGIMNIASSQENLKYKISNIQKRGPVMYLQAIYLLENVELDGEVGRDLYLVNEWIMISRERDLLVIETVAPSKNQSFSEDHFADHVLWLTSFHIGKAKF